MSGFLPRARTHVASQSRRRWLGAGLVVTLVSATLVGTQVPAPALAAPGDPFDPQRPTIFIAQENPTQLQRAETDGSGSFVFVDEGGPASVAYNAIGFNPNDNYIYGIVAGGQTTTALPAGSLVRVGQSGRVTRVGTRIYQHSTASNGKRWFAGAVNPADGRFYISDSGPNTTMQVINLSNGNVARTITFPAAPGVQDFAFLDGYAWGANNDGTVRRFNVTNGTITNFPNVVPPTTGGYGAVWNFGNGNLGFSANATGDVVQLQIRNGTTNSPTFTVVSVVPGPSSNLNDGTSIPGLPTDLAVLKSGPAYASPGGTVTYTITVSNEGPGDSSGWTVSDTLPSGLNAPVISGPVTSSIVGNTITASGGQLDAGESVSFTIRATLNAGVDACITNTATVAGNERDTNSANDSSAWQVCPPSVELTKESNASTTTRVGDTITYTVRARNTGAQAYTAEHPLTVMDDMSDVLDDATVTVAPAADRPGTITMDGTRMMWQGALAAGDEVTVTTSVTLRSAGDGRVRNIAWIPRNPQNPSTPACTTAPGGVDATSGEPCATTSHLLPRLTVSKTANSNTIPNEGAPLSYEIVVTNLGPGTLDGAEVALTDDLSDVLDDADFGAVSASTGSASLSGTTLTWSGTLAPNASATISYDVSPHLEGDGVLRNQACIPASLVAPGATACDAVQVPGPEWTMWKTAVASSSPVEAGATITYRLFFKNNTAAPVAIAAEDDFSRVIDDATVTTAPATSSALTIATAGSRYLISGTLAASELAEVTYVVTVREPEDRGDSVATNFLLLPGDEPPANGLCTDSSIRPTCTTTPMSGVVVTKSVSASETPAQAGTVLTYTVTVTNAGTTPATLRRDDILSDVLDDAEWVSGPTASSPTVLASGPVDDVVTLRGTVDPNSTVTITYAVRIKPLHDRGNMRADNFLVPPGENAPATCQDTSTQCTSTPIMGYEVSKSVDITDVRPGDVVTYTITTTNVGQIAYTDDNPASWTDDLSDVLDDAQYNADASGGAVLNGTTLSWSGPLTVAATHTSSYSVTVDEHSDGNHRLRNLVVPTAPSGACVAAEECVTTTPIPAFTVLKEASAEAVVGRPVTYTITVTNISAVDYTELRPARLTDDLTDILTRAVYNDDLTPNATLNEGVIVWQGALKAGESDRITFSVTPTEPGLLRNSLTTPVTLGGNCVESDRADGCIVERFVLPQGLSVTGIAVVDRVLVLGAVLFMAGSSALLFLLWRRRRGYQR